MFLAPDDTHMRPEHRVGRHAPMKTTMGRMVLGASSLRAKALVCDFLVQKARNFSPSSYGNSPYKYYIPHSQFLIQNEVVQEEGKHLKLQGRIFSPHSRFL